MSQVDTAVYRVAFAGIKGLSLANARELLHRVGSEERFFTLDRRSLSAVSGLPDDLTADSYRRSLLEAATREFSFINDNRIGVSFFTDSSYPHRLAECDDAPAALFTLGKCNLDSAHVVAIVGTRHATAYGVSFTTSLVRALADAVDDLVIVSGLAYGIDIAAHKAALQCGVPTVTVVAHGLNTIYPADHRSIAARIVGEGGAIVTEYTSASRIHKGSFLARNRIVAGLSDALVVAESDSRGGAMTTARLASAYNREVFALPGRTIDTYSRGCNNLIASQSAIMLRDADDILTAMNWQRRPVEGSQPSLFADFTLSPLQTSVVDFLRRQPEATVNEMCEVLALPYQSLSSVLFDLEMHDVITAVPGGRYIVTGA